MQQPPKLPLKILRFFCAEHRLEEIEGDLFEEFQDQVQSYGYSKARRLYYWTVIRSFRSYLFDYQNNSTHPLSFITMTQHYLKTAFRGMYKHKSFTAINILGLSLGLSCFILLSLFLTDVILKDNFIPNRAEIYRLEVLNPLDFTDKYEARTHPDFVVILNRNYPQVENYLRINALNENMTITVKNGDKKEFYKQRGIEADTSFFSFFPFELITGNQKTALLEKHSIIVSESMATMLFGDEDPIGKMVYLPIREGAAYTVSGILKDIKQNSSLQFDYIVPNYIPYDIASGAYSLFANYLMFSPETDIKQITTGFNNTIKDAGAAKRLQNLKYRLTKFEEVKFDIQSTDNVVQTINKGTVALIAIVALLILILAVFNYINLTAARALQKGQEAGIRKIIGAGRGSFVFQFLTESLIFCVISMLISLLVLEISLPYFESILGTSLHYDYKSSFLFFLIYFGLIVLLALLSALYPALLVSRFRFSEFLKGKAMSSTKGNMLRKGLVVFQFSISIILTLGAVMVQKQLRYIQNETLSYNPEQILIVERAVSSNLDDFKKSLKDIPEVSISSLTSSPPGGENLYASGSIAELDIRGYYHQVDGDYINMLKLKITEGANFDSKLTSDIDQGVIINETMANIIRSKNPMNLDDPLSGKYSFLGIPTKIRGVVKDFHIGSFHNEIQPIALMYHNFTGYSGARVMIKVSSTNISETLAKIETKWNEFIPNSKFGVEFMDAKFDQLYTAETRLANIFKLFTVIALFISSLGLLGLIGFITESKIKEVGIRKVMGASVGQILFLFTGQVYKLILAACLVGVPVAYWLINRWLDNFAYKTSFSFDIVFIVVLFMFILTSLTIIFKSAKAATHNPVDALRSE
ncbi:FtsX-like permease family protein [uncultured Roseivirga sp.]|uniref:FtsX-like permease family protein n=1 Tax=uncultured Roseivirga sp. TaxID=543088 RepID=UPI0030DB08AB|tara:strand:- start:270156 stop:272762 length:2607 start_codon:yes stop_codon:yes gene_type:complete